MRTQEGRFKPTALFFGTLFACVGLLPGYSFSQAPFYQGKTVTLIATTAPGGTGDLRVKAMVPFLRKHIPGNPTVVIEYMDGGGGRKGANHIYNSVRPDGLTIGAASGAIVGLGIMREQGVSYDVDKFIYLGTPEHENHYVIYTRRELGLDNLEKLKAKPGIRIGGQSVGHVSYVAGRFFAYFLDFKEPKFIVGYTSPEVDIALVNGELDARANAAVSVLRRNPEWLDKGLMNFHAIMEVPKGDKHPRLGHLPEVESFAKTEREKRVLAVWRAFRGVGSPYILPPGTPKDRVEILEEAMRKIFRDPEFPKYFQKLVADDASPLGPAELNKVVREMPRDAEILELIKKFSGAGPLPPR
ncbi:MAG: Bug family tripartite tricarboxylate transporter substrate binding protein [Candidatus Binatia bacterium]